METAHSRSISSDFFLHAAPFFSESLFRRVLDDEAQNKLSGVSSNNEIVWLFDMVKCRDEISSACLSSRGKGILK